MDRRFGIVLLDHFKLLDLEEPAAGRPLQQRGRLLGPLHQANQPRDVDPGVGAVDERVVGHHVGEQFGGLFIFGEFQEREEHRDGAARHLPLLFPRGQSAGHRRKLTDRGHGLAAHDPVVLLTDAECRGEKGGIGRNGGHTAVRQSCRWGCSQGAGCGQASQQDPGKTHLPHEPAIQPAGQTGDKGQEHTNHRTLLRERIGHGGPGRCQEWPAPPAR